jgi:hypothetical protein
MGKKANCCGQCNGCLANQPDQFDIEIGGVQNNAGNADCDCSNCSGINGTHTVAPYGWGTINGQFYRPDATSCYWEGQDSWSCSTNLQGFNGGCEGAPSIAYIQLTISKYAITVTLDGGPNPGFGLVATWQQNYSDGIDCMNLSDEEIHFSGSTLPCDFEESHCKVTTVAQTSMLKLPPTEKKPCACHDREAAIERQRLALEKRLRS